MPSITTLYPAISRPSIIEALDGKQPLDPDLTALAAAGNSSVLVNTTSAFTTAKNNKLGAWIDAKADGGLVGDGSTNDSSAFDAMVSAAAEGSVISIPPGTYILRSTHTLTKKLHWVSNSATLKRDSSVDGFAKPMIIVDSGAEQSSFSGIIFDHNAVGVAEPAMAAATAYALMTPFLIMADDVSVTDCHAINAWDSGFSVGKVTITGNGTGGSPYSVVITAGSPERVRISNCHAENCGHAVHTLDNNDRKGLGFNILNGSKCIVDNCTAYECSGGFAADYGNNASATFSACTAIGSKYDGKMGFWIADGPNILSGCKALFCEGDGFVIPPEANGVTLSGCYAYANDRHGFNIGSGEVSLTGCKAQSNSNSSPNTYSGFFLNSATVALQQIVMSGCIAFENTYQKYGLDAGGVNTIAAQVIGCSFDGATGETNIGSYGIAIISNKEGTRNFGFNTPTPLQKLAVSGGVTSYLASAIGDTGNEGVFGVNSESTPAKRLAFAYDDTNDVAIIQALQAAVATKKLLLNPSGGSVMIGTGAYDTGPVQLGSRYIWIDATGTLRIKTSAPGSDLDGEVVGVDGDFMPPIVGTTTSQVPASVKDRFRHWANAREDFGIRLYEDDGTTIRDNTTRLQAAIDKLQAVNGCLWFPMPDESSRSLSTGPLTLRDTSGYEGKSMSMVATSYGDPSMTTRDFTVPSGQQYNSGVFLKLKSGGNGAIITSPDGAGHLVLEKMGLDGNYTAQSGDYHAIDVQNLASGYGQGVKIRDCCIINAAKQGLYLGQARAMSSIDDTAIMYCGSSTQPAMLVNAYDTQINRLGIGQSRGVGLYIGTTAQFEMHGGAIWESESYNLQISPNALTVNISGVHFDGTQSHSVVIEKSTDATRRAVRVLSNCMFSGRNATGSGATTPNTYSDILTSCEDLTLIAPMFAGSADSPATAIPKHHIEFTSSTARALIVGESYRSNTYGTAFTDDWSCIRRSSPFGTVPAGVTNRFDGIASFYVKSQYDGLRLYNDSGTIIANIIGGDSSGKTGALYLYDSSGNVALRMGASTSLTGDPIIPLRQFADDAAAAAASPAVAIGSLYLNTTTGAPKVRMT